MQFILQINTLDEHGKDLNADEQIQQVSLWSFVKNHQHHTKRLKIEGKLKFLMSLDTLKNENISLYIELVFKAVGLKET